jgi:oligopeptide/dipeptide ABC transporter ATP-binding protein
VAIVGPSGCGKSTLLNMVAGTLRPSSGSVSYDGRLVDGPNSDVGYITQKNYCVPWRTVEGNVRMPLEFRRMPKDEITERVRYALAQVGLTGFEKAYPKQLSGGMLQRVMIAAALLTGPRLLLADEPTTALDVTTQAEVMAILDDLRREFGLAMLFITHDLDLAAAICDRTAVMYAGQIVEVRSSTLLHTDPLHPYTAALAAARPDIARAANRLRAIPGRPLSAFEAPPGECAFAPRCAYASDICREAGPEIVELDGGMSRCARAHDLRGQLQDASHA